MIKVGFIGVPGSGKTSTSRAIAAACRRHPQLKNVELVSEYARRYIAKYKSISHIWEQFRIMQKQVEWENSASYDDLDLLITDSPVFNSFAYCIDLRAGRDLESKDIMIMNDMFKESMRLNDPIRYDMIFHLSPSLKPVNDGIRPQSNFDDDWRMVMDRRFQVVYEIFQPKFFIDVTETDLSKRVEFCIKHILVLFGETDEN